MIKKYTLLVVLFVGVNLFAQRSTSSPYSFLGLGDEFDPTSVEQSSMGGVGVAFSDSYHLNLMNPASLSDLKFSTYVFGMSTDLLTVKDQTSKETNNTTRLNYFGFATHIGKNIGFSFGLQPVSSVGYSLNNPIYNTNDELEEYTQFSGDGGVNRLYGGLGVRLFKWLSVGAEADFTFGKIENSILNQRRDVFLATKHQEDLKIRGFKIKVGTQLKTPLIKEKLNLFVGGTVEFSNNLDAEGDVNQYSLLIGATGTQIPRDTIYTGTVSGMYKNPLTTTVGIGLGKDDHWYLGAEYRMKDAIEIEGFNQNTTSSNTFRYGSSSRISAGGFFIPKFNSISSYWDRMTYRAGVRLEETGLLVNGTPGGNVFTPIKDFGINFGVGLPLGKRSISNVNLGLEYGKRGTLDNNLIEENYFKLRFSISFNDRWFAKRTID